MAERITKAHVESAFHALLRELGKEEAQSYNDVGAYRLDYAGEYGGYMIYEITGAHGGENGVYGHQRHSAREMYDMIWFAVEVLRTQRREKGEAQFAASLAHDQELYARIASA